jgi:Flp pilus assembly protein TadD
MGEVAMPKCVRRLVVVLSLVLGCISPEVAGQQPPTDVEPPGLETPKTALPPALEAYLDGLTALETAKWADAIAAFSKAIEADPDNEAYHRARGVANTLAEKLDSALTDLRRSGKLKIGDKESRIWLAVALQMSGDDYHAARPLPRRPTTPTRPSWARCAGNIG